MHTFADVVS